VRDLVVDSTLADDPDAHCVTVTAVKDGVEQVYKAKYALGSDGAHSQVRKSLGFKMVGDSSDEVWGVMDVYPRTDFPDIRKKAIIKSKSGNLIIIPREGDSLARMYMNLSSDAVAAKDVTLAQLHEKAKQIFQPYNMEFPETAWWSAYVIGQRLADKFHAHHRVFLGGDACHTHSPKAGQGMNVSLQDGYNIGWKLAAVLRKQATPELLKTYVLERQKTAADLIDFDRYWSKLFSTTNKHGRGGMTPELFVKAGRYTAGLATRYDDSKITAAAAGQASLAAKLTLASDLERLIRAFTPPGSDLDSVFNIILVLSSKRADVELEGIPEIFTPMTGKWRLKNILKVFVDDKGHDNTHGHAYEAYGITPSEGVLVIVRPDQYIARIGPLDDVQGIDSFFSGLLRRSNP
ncbi:hypothetical protein CIB48_g4677, partial [Xylaria polymorpha]